MVATLGAPVWRFIARRPYHAAASMAAPSYEPRALSAPRRRWGCRRHPPRRARNRPSICSSRTCRPRCRTVSSHRRSSSATRLEQPSALARRSRSSPASTTSHGWWSDGGSEVAAKRQLLASAGRPPCRVGRATHRACTAVGSAASQHRRG